MLYKIILNNDYDGRVYLPKEFINTLEDKSYSFTRICAGLKECDILTFLDSALKSDEIKISSDLINDLSIPRDLSYQIKCAGNTINLGPIIGLLLDKKNTEKRLKKYLPYTLIYNKIGGLLYVFSLEGINYDDKVVEGFFYRPETTNWEKAVLPFPQAIYRRIYMAKKTIEKLQMTTGGRMFNNHFFDKWKFWNVASKYPQVAKNLPETKLLKTLADIDIMFKSFDTLFLKPKRGTLGRGLVRVEKINKQYVFKERDIKKPILTYGKKEASKYISDISQRTDYIIQQNIELLNFEDSYSDFRVIMQKDNTLEWQCTGIVVSMGESGGICSNYYNSRYLSFEDFFSKYLSLSKEKVYQKQEEVVDLCKRVCEVLDLEMGNYGDVGIDIGIDRSLTPWIFEVNQRHYHIMPLLIDDYQAFDNIKSNPIKYATALSGFNLV